MQSLHYYYLFTAMAILSLKLGSCKHLPQTTSGAETDIDTTSPCSIKMEHICSSIEEAENYSLEFNTDNFLQRSGEIQGKKSEIYNSIQEYVEP